MASLSNIEFLKQYGFFAQDGKGRWVFKQNYGNWSTEGLLVLRPDCLLVLIFGIILRKYIRAYTGFDLVRAHVASHITEFDCTNQGQRS